jgi:VWFA-related protein
MRPHMIACGLITTLFIIGYADGFQEQRSAPQTIRVRVRLVPVDVMVSDTNGKPVADLKREDFTILENGSPQEIRHFEFQTIKPRAPDPAGGMLRKIPAAELAPQSARTFLILLGSGLHRSFGSIGSLIRFVREDLLPQDRVAVFAYNRATDFTVNHEQVAQVLERYDKSHGKLDAAPKPIQAAVDRIFDDPATIGFRRIAPARVPEAGSIVDKRGMGYAFLRGLLEDQDQDTGTRLSFDDYVSEGAGVGHVDLQMIYTGIEYLRFMEGEKHLLFFVEKGLSLPWQTQVQLERDVAAIANDARVAIDTFQTGGVELHPAVAAMDASVANPQSPAPSTFPPLRLPLGPADWILQAWQLASLRKISEYTGGLAAIHRDIGKALDRVDEAARAWYLLGYYPDNDRWDGSYRQIEVRVNRPGVNVRFRHGYFARETPELYDREKFMAYSRISAAASNPATNFGDIRFTIKATESTGTGEERQVRLDLQIDPANIGFRTVNGLHTAKLHIGLFYADGARHRLGDDSQVLDMSLREETYQGVLKSGFIPFSAAVPLVARKQLIKVIIYDPGSDRVGGAQVQLP